MTFGSMRTVLIPEHIRLMTLCGSTRFQRLYEEFQARYTTLGYFVWTVACYRRPDGGMKLSDHEKASGDFLHLQKIAASDLIFVVDGKVDGLPYLGESTRKEMAFARERNIPIVRFSEQFPAWSDQDFLYA